MDHIELKDLINNGFPEAVVEQNAQFLSWSIPAEDSFEFISSLNRDYHFDTLSCLTAVDWTTHFNVVYHLYSRKYHQTVVVKARIDNRENPVADSIVSLWKGAELLEREVFEMFGITFRNHPDLRKLFLTNEMVGYPLRKDFKDDENIIEW